MKRWAWVLLAILSVGLLGYLWRLTSAIQRQSQAEEAQPADVIIVLGAAEYHGRPSPVLKARLDHALELYLRGLAPHILTTGGAGGDPVWTESEVGRKYLAARGVPVEDIIVETESDSTVETTSAVGEIMRRMNLQSCILVSDGYHIFRAKRMLETQGFRVYGSPRPSQPKGEWSQRWLSIRQALAYSLWSVGISI